MDGAEAYAFVCYSSVRLSFWFSTWEQNNSVETSKYCNGPMKHTHTVWHVFAVCFGTAQSALVSSFVDWFFFSSSLRPCWPHPPRAGRVVEMCLLLELSEVLLHVGCNLCHSSPWGTLSPSRRTVGGVTSSGRRCSTCLGYTPWMSWRQSAGCSPPTMQPVSRLSVLLLVILWCYFDRVRELGPSKSSSACSPLVGTAFSLVVTVISEPGACNERLLSTLWLSQMHRDVGKFQ